jgi:hypothetical protein
MDRIPSASASRHSKVMRHIVAVVAHLVPAAVYSSADEFAEGLVAHEAPVLLVPASLHHRFGETKSLDCA